MVEPEGPLCYVGVVRQSAAFRLMKQMGWKTLKDLVKTSKGLKVMLGLKTSRILQVWVWRSLMLGLLILHNLTAFSRNCKSNERKQITKLFRMTMTTINDDQVKQTSVPEPKVVDEKIVKVTRLHGRYQRRERGKQVLAYSSKDLEGILVKKPSVLRKVQMKMMKLMKLKISNQKAKEMLFKSFLNIGGPTSLVLSHAWSKVLKKKPVESEKAQNGNGRTMFYEKDQENLYSLVQDNATAGKQGLGIKRQPKKIIRVSLKERIHYFVIPRVMRIVTMFPSVLN